MVKKKRIIAVVQARLGSKRFPRKVLKKINNLSIVEIINKRLTKSKLLDEIVFAIPSSKENQKLYNHLSQINCKIFRGDENNVTKRYFNAAVKFNADIIVRVTSDCPLVDPKMVDNMIRIFLKSNLDYLSNNRDFNNPNDKFFYPDGFDIEIFNKNSLKISKNKSKTNYYKQHVTTFIRNSNQFRKKYIKYNNSYNYVKLSIDEKYNFLNVKKIFKQFYPNIFFSFDQIVKSKILEKLFCEELKKTNIMQKKIKESLSLWTDAKAIIPGGNMLLSKNPDRYIPNTWPTYFKSAKGCKIVDFDNNKFLDLSTMGVGTNILGYGDSKVDAAVMKAIKLGNLSTLNCPEEVKLAKKLIELHPWFQMVKFARTGGEANSVAIRIARAASGKDNVAFCGYHGWHDWYLSTNLNNKNKNNLNNHLMNDLRVDGVPKKLKDTAFGFNYGDYNKLNKLIEKKNIGIIKMEVCRNTEPNIPFLKKVRRLATKKNIILIFDECTTGFRETCGGLHKKIKIIPDMTILGKALGNGYAITAILGKKEIMKSANNSFISSTFWTERIGYVAALKTIEEMQKIRSWEKINQTGLTIRKRWKKIFNKYNLNVSIRGIKSLSNFVFNSKHHQAYKTFITQEMLRKNILATNTIYVSTKHSDKILKPYFNNLERISKIISLCENDGHDIRKFLKTEISLKDFYRYN